VKMSGDGLACLDEGRVATERLDGSHCLRRVWYRGHSWWWCTLHEFLWANTDTACATMSVPRLHRCRTNDNRSRCLKAGFLP
jgi:hypothetical protein